MIAFAARWLSGDERTLGALLALGVLTTPFTKVDWWRDALGVAPTPGIALAVLLVVAAIAWRSVLRRGFVWLAPSVLTWQDFGEFDRARAVGERMLAGWLGRLLALGYLGALLGALATVPAGQVLAALALVLASGVLALALARRVPRTPGAETAGVLVLAALAVAVRPGPGVLLAAAAVLVVAAVVTLARSGSPRRPEIAVHAGRAELVRGWRDRLVRSVGVSFLDLGMLLPAARPARSGMQLLRASTTSLALVGVLGRAHCLPVAGLLALAAVAAHLAFPALPGVVLLALFGYLAVMPFGGGLGELWRSTGRRRWTGRSDTVLRGAHLTVLCGLTACWALPVLGLAALTGAGLHPLVLLAVPVIAACVVRTSCRPLPRYDATTVDTPMGMVPVGLIGQVVRGPDLGVLAVWLLTLAVPLVVSLMLVTGVVLLSVLR